MAVISGTKIDDSLNGTKANDLISGLTGDDTLFGLGGNDTLDGGSGHDTMVGGIGDDTYIEDSRFDVFVEAAGEGRDTILASSNVYLAGSTAEIEIVQVTSTAGRQVIGNATVDQTLIGNSGADDLRSGGVHSTLIGGAGDDMYFVNSDDTVIENANGGVDLVFFNASGGSNSFTLGANLENVSANDASPLAKAVLTGNDLDNTISGLNAADTLSGLGGADVLIGGAGNDVLDGGSGLDTLIGGTGDDTYIIADTTNLLVDYVSEAAGEGRDTILASKNVNLAGLGNFTGLPLEIEVVQVTRTTATQIIGNSTANQTLIGNVGDDDLRAVGAGATLIGGAGNDLYFADSSISIVESAGQGIDTVMFNQASGPSNSFTLGANLENLSVNNVDFNVAAVLTGNATGNVITGLNAADTLVGLAGNDSLQGNARDDKLFGGSFTGDLIADSIGNDGVDTLDGGTGNDTLNGGGGVDTMIGGSGDDFYVAYSVEVNGSGQQIFDTIIEAGSGGIDTVLALNNYSLTTGQEIEVLQLGTSSDLTGVGNERDNTIFGNSGSNVIAGLQGHDILVGQQGNDTFLYRGGDGIDQIADFTGAGLAVGDVVLLQGTGVTNFAQLQGLIFDIAGGSQIVFDPSNVIVFSNVSKAEFSAGDFLFG